ncbi:hypothetical protein F4X33_15405, partial [Candidatus Poribacteria bacterium]|nr:hypothetical protein [Candidatus Poribacteria bacterium]
MHTLSILLKSSWQGWLNSIQYASEERRKKVVEIIGFLVIIAALYLIGHAIFKVVGQQAEADGQTILRAINICVGLGVFILVKSAMESTIKKFYEDADTSLLLSSVSSSTVFGFKLIQLIAANLLGMVMWLFTPWIAFGRLFGLPWHFYLGLIPACFCLLVIIITNVVVVVMLIMRFFSSQRIMQVSKIVGAIIGAVAGFFLAFSVFTFAWSDEIATFLLERLKFPISDWYPHLWTAKFMMSWLPESGIQPLRWIIQLVVASIVIPFFTVLLASQIYHRSWEYARHIEVNPRQNDKKRRSAALLGRGRIRSMMVKDFHVFLRHKGRVTMIVILTLLQLIPISTLVYQMQTDDKIYYAVYLPNLAAIAVQIMIYSVIVTAGLSWGGCKTEAKTWWLLKSSSISPALLFDSKLVIGTLCAVGYAAMWLLVVLILSRIPFQLGLPILLMTAVITASATAFNTAMGTLPWVAEIGDADRDFSKQPVVRLATLLVTIIANLILLSAPIMILQMAVLGKMQFFGGEQSGLLSTAQQLTIGLILIILIGVWVISY